MAGSNFFADLPGVANTQVALTDSTGLAVIARCTGTPATTANKFAKGCTMVQEDASGRGTYENTGTSASPVWDLIGQITSAELAPELIQYAKVTISKADILALNTTPKVILPVPGANKCYELISAALGYTRVTATYGGGGNVSLQLGAGPLTVSTVLSAAASFGSGTNEAALLRPTTASIDVTAELNQAMELTCATGDFTDPGTADGTGFIAVAYRVWDFT